MPSTFDPTDSSQRFSKYLHPIRDQAKCGSCWAFGASEALSDRYSIFSNGTINVVLSPQELVSCDSTNHGCGGGWIQNAWDYLERFGISDDSCYPYSSGKGDSGTCDTKKCPKKYSCTKNSIVLCSDPAHIKAELYTHGPLETRFNVYEDFHNYAGGIYVHTTGKRVGGHAIKVVGYGYDTNLKLEYWICANSWGTDWGLNGYFYIAFGQCGIDQ